MLGIHLANLALTSTEGSTETQTQTVVKEAHHRLVALVGTEYSTADKLVTLVGRAVVATEAHLRVVYKTHRVEAAEAGTVAVVVATACDTQRSGRSQVQMAVAARHT